MNRGMAALITVIILGSLIVLIGTVMTLTSISEGQSVVTETKIRNTQGLLDACAEESLIRINENNTLPSTIITTLGSCTATVNSQVGTSWDFNLSSIDSDLNIVLSRGTSISVKSWLDQ